MSELVDETDLKFVGETHVGSTPTTPTILELYPEFHTVYGPYTRKDGRKVVILYDGIRRSARQYAKVLLEMKLGRRLVDEETVDHKDRDVTNNDPENLILTNHSENASQASYKPSAYSICVICAKKFKLSRNQRNKRGLAKLKFCSRKCITDYRRLCAKTPHKE